MTGPETKLTGGIHLTDADKARLALLGGEPLAGSGFEGEEPEPGFAESGFGDTETSGPVPGQDPA